MSAVIPIGRQFLTVDELIGLGLTYYKINRLVDEGKLVKVSKSMYENTAFDGDMSDFSIVSAFAPKGVFCMMQPCHPGRMFMFGSSLKKGIAWA